MSKITINRGSDLTLTGTWRDANGTAMDLTGWTITDYDGHASMQGNITAQWVDASQGTYTVTMQWADAMFSGMSFRLRISNGTQDVSSPAITVIVQ